MSIGKRIGKLFKKPELVYTTVSEKEIKTTSPRGINFLIAEEGIRLKPYRDSAGVPTIGIGSTYYENGVRVKMTDPEISKERAVQLFRNLLVHYEKAVWSNTRDDINQNQFDALVSFAYNVGASALKSSTLLKRVNNYSSEAGIKDAFMMWRNSDGKPILLNRRIREANLYLTMPKTSSPV